MLLHSKEYKYVDFCLLLIGIFLVLFKAKTIVN